MRAPRLTHQMIIGVDQPIFGFFDALAQGISPPQSKSALGREALYFWVQQKYPREFQNYLNNKSAEKPAE